jgi:hypothetical protein
MGRHILSDRRLRRANRRRSRLEPRHHLWRFCRVAAGNGGDVTACGPVGRSPWRPGCHGCGRGRECDRLCGSRLLASARDVFRLLDDPWPRYAADALRRRLRNAGPDRRARRTPRNVGDHVTRGIGGHRVLAAWPYSLGAFRLAYRVDCLCRLRDRDDTAAPGHSEPAMCRPAARQRLGSQGGRALPTRVGCLLEDGSMPRLPRVHIFSMPVCPPT